MTLEFEKLGNSLIQMGMQAKSYYEKQQRLLTEVRHRLNDFATDWGEINRCLTIIGEKAPDTRLAKPLYEEAPLNAGIPLPATIPQHATIFATDGSQIMPDRHSAFLYYLINIGCITYHHGNGLPPEQASHPSLEFEETNLFVNEQLVSGTVVSARRDLQEIETLAQLLSAGKEQHPPLLALLDQRLLYWPYWSPSANPEERNAIVKGWQSAMSQIRQSGALLAGYIDASRRNSVIHLLSLLNSTAIDYYTFLREKAAWSSLTDSDLFVQILQPGERSPIFLDVSKDNVKYSANDPLNEVCFFYLNVAGADSGRRHLARVDVPRWVADDLEAIAIVHGLLYDQCQILGEYPYVLARADEAAVVGRQDEADLNGWIALEMDRNDISLEMSAKQGSKDLARAGKNRHEM